MTRFYGTQINRRTSSHKQYANLVKSSVRYFINYVSCERSNFLRTVYFVKWLQLVEPKGNFNCLAQPWSNLLKNGFIIRLRFQFST